MIAYNPSVNDRSGELIAGGISQAASGISGAINQINELKMKQQAAQGALGAAQGLVDKGYMDQSTLDKINALPPMQQIGAAQNILPMLQAAGMMDYHKSLIDMKGAALDQKGAAGGSMAAPLY
jgi:hypothetical protein